MRYPKGPYNACSGIVRSSPHCRRLGRLECTRVVRSTWPPFTFTTTRLFSKHCSVAALDCLEHSSSSSSSCTCGLEQFDASRVHGSCQGSTAQDKRGGPAALHELLYLPRRIMDLSFDNLSNLAVELSYGHRWPMPCDLMSLVSKPPKSHDSYVLQTWIFLAANPCRKGLNQG
jgi:hypothetical protein